MVAIENIHKTFGLTTALSGVRFEVAEGELFGLIGPDGAGKTTLFRILVTLLVPDRGTATVDDLDVVRDVRALRRRLGYMPGRFSLYPDLTVEENLTFFASVFGTTAAANYDWIRPIYEQLEPFRHRRAGALSGGMKQKLALSCALVHRPRVLVLDEPTTGVDAVSRAEFWENLAVMKDSGVTILVSTPYMDEARRCDRVALLQNGSILEVDRPAEIERRFERRLFGIRARGRRALLEALREHPQAHSVFRFGDSIHFAAAGADLRPELLGTYLEERGFHEADVALIEPGIEDVFMERMQRV
jgi:ABC-type multidrug transport system ATPase subunit